MTTRQLHKESVAFWAILATFLALNIIGLTRHPKVFIDEVTDSDVAYNLATGHGFMTNSVVFSHLSQYGRWGDFFVFNPLYHILLAGWFLKWGFGIFQSRSFDICLAALTGLIFYYAAKRPESGIKPIPRLCLLAILFFSEEFVRSYRGHRYDFLCTTWFSILFASSLVDRRNVRLVLLFIVSALQSLTAFNGIILEGIILIYLFYMQRQRAIASCLAAGFGMIAGLIVYVGINILNGTLDTFIATISPFAEGTYEQKSVLMLGWEGLKLGPSGIILVAAAVILLYTEPYAAFRKQVGTLGACVLVLPFLMSWAGHYCYDYTWNMLLPSALLYVMACSAIAVPSRSQLCIMVTPVILICGVGLPLHTAQASLEWRERNPALVSNMLEKYILPDDVVIFDPPAYYPCRSIAKDIILSSSLPLLTQDQKGQITLAALSFEGNPIRPHLSHSNLLSQIGGEWTCEDVLVIPRSALRRRLLFFPPKEGTVNDIQLFRRKKTPIPPLSNTPGI
jgi:hypothetical protein